MPARACLHRQTTSLSFRCWSQLANAVRCNWDEEILKPFQLWRTKGKRILCVSSCSLLFSHYFFYFRWRWWGENKIISFFPSFLWNSIGQNEETARENFGFSNGNNWLLLQRVFIASIDHWTRWPSHTLWASLLRSFAHIFRHNFFDCPPCCTHSISTSLVVSLSAAYALPSLLLIYYSFLLLPLLFGGKKLPNNIKINIISKTTPKIYTLAH